MAEAKFTGAHLSGPLNSTHFTDCCGLAVLREDTNCPGCGALVIARPMRARSANCLMCGRPRNVCYC